MANKSYEVTTEAGGQVYSGIGRAASTPLRDLNLMREKVPSVLIRAQDRPYDAVGLETCDAIMAEVSALDQALGPDLDQPRVEIDRMHRGASYAAQAALDGVADIAGGVIPMRSWVKRLSGAARAESEVRRAVLSGSVRRGFLKALGMNRNCEWPAAPMGFTPTQVATAASPSPASAASLPQTAAVAGAITTASTSTAVSTHAPVEVSSSPRPSPSAPAGVSFASHRPSGGS